MTDPSDDATDPSQQGPPHEAPPADPAEPAPFEAATLAEAMTLIGLEATPEQVERLDAYRKLLWAWNEKLNLTRHTTLEKFVTRDLVDTAAFAERLAPGERVLDVGSGGGVPGVPLAILRPDVEIALCESVGKKARVLDEITAELGLEVPVHAARLEATLDAERYETLVARAVAPLWKFFLWLQERGERYDRLLLLKGPGWVDERADARHRGLAKPFDLRREAEYTTPRSSMVSTLLCVTPKRTAPRR